MLKLAKEYFEELNKQQRKKRNTGIAIMLLVIVVAGSMAGILIQYGSAMTDKPKCGLEEHTHGESCYEETLTCGLEEGAGHIHTEECSFPEELACGLEESEGHTHTEECRAPEELICGMEESEDHTHTEECRSVPEGYICGVEESEGHTHISECYRVPEGFACGMEESENHIHGDACYTKTFVCEQEEHEHTDVCYIDTSADVEDAADWNALYANADWKGVWGEDLVMAAQMQIGYRESTENCKITEEGIRKGYTRYGHFCGDAYADWDAAFVNFCLYYAGMKSIEPPVFADETDSAKWCEEFEKVREENAAYLTDDKSYIPAAGDIVFFQKDNEETPCQMGIVSFADEAKSEIFVIEGNSQNEVKENRYAIGDTYIVRYLKISELEAAYKNIKDTEDPEETEELPVELTAEADGITITLSGPASSFEAGKEYSIQAEKVEKKETIEVIEEAIANLEEVTTSSAKTAASGEEPAVTAQEPAADKEPAAENQDAGESREQAKQVKSYQAFDIKLMADGEEVQPIGPVSVKFSGQEVMDSVEDEETEVSVIHVDETTGEATDMEAVATEEKDVVIETNHFSVYVYVEVGVDAIEGVDIDIQHWGENISTIDDAVFSMNGGNKEEAFDTTEKKVVTKEGSWKLYSTDENCNLASESYTDIRNLSKVYNADQEEYYRITKVWVSKPGRAANCKEDEASWGSTENYTEYTAEDLKSENVVDEITHLRNGSVIRFWYTPNTESKTVRNDVTFYDYDFSAGVESGNILKTEEKGINAKENFSNNGKPKLGIGQQSSGNLSKWVLNTFNGKFLNKGNDNKEFPGLVQNNLVNGQPAFQAGIDAPGNLFSHDPEGGSWEYKDYQLEFSQNGDTYTLINVYKGDTVTFAQNLTEFKDMPNWNKTRYVYSNDFWPLDGVENRTDPLLGEKHYTAKNDAGNVKIGLGRGKDENGNNLNNNDFQTEEGHNWYFGMAYQVKFKLGDYVGPLEYYFRGDDDFWLFVDGELKIDLGGIHTAIGKTCDLSYLYEQDKNKEHTLDIFYMERGAFGSTCYMQFTLPRIVVQPNIQTDVTSYTVEKKWEDNENGFRPQDIRISLYKQKEGEAAVKARTITLPLKNEAGAYVDQEGNEVQEPVWTYTWKNLPKEDGKTGKKIVYDAEEEYLDDANKENPMLGYYYNKVSDPNDSTKITFTNYIVDKRIKVRKEWQDDEKEQANRPDQVTFVLYANGTEYIDYRGERRTVELSEENNWQGEFTHIPEYYYNADTKKWEKVVYTVREEPALNDTEFEGKNGAIYEIEIEGLVIDQDDTIAADQKKNYIASFKAVNTLVTKNVCIEKVSRSDNKKYLQGAEFALYQCNEENVDENGKLKPAANPMQEGCITNDAGQIAIRGLRFGEYYLKEIEAPVGYLLLEHPIKITVTKEGVTADFQIEGWDAGSHVTLKTDNDESKYLIQIPNEMFYELPSAGGAGIYWYIFGGLFLMAAALLLYKEQNRKELMQK